MTIFERICGVLLVVLVLGLLIGGIAEIANHFKRKPKARR